MRGFTISKTAYDVTLDESGKLVACGKTENSISVTPDQYAALHNNYSLVNDALVAPLSGEALILSVWNTSGKTSLDKLAAAKALYALQNINEDIYIMARVNVDVYNDSTLWNQLLTIQAAVNAKLV